MGRSCKGQKPYKQRGELFRLVAEGLFKPFTRLWRETARSGSGNFLGMIMNGVAQEAELFAVTAAPFANEQVKAQPEAL
jgi:hypothetical protein